MSHNKAQTLIELAVFGSILVFILGMIIRQGLAFGYLQNQSLRAMRMALTTSYMYSEGLKDTGPKNSKPGKGVASRNSASILIVEDRLTADALKFGSIERSPYINSATGTFTRNLYLPTDINYEGPVDEPAGVPEIIPPTAGETYNLPFFDVYVNGIHFPFTTSGFAQISRVDPQPDPDGTFHNYRYYYTRVPNNLFSGKWCLTDPCPCIRRPNYDDKDEFIDLDIETCDKFDVDSRFDLKRCGIDRGDLDDCTANPNEFKITDAAVRKTFAWQWDAIDEKDLRSGASIDIDRDLKEESVITIDEKNNKIIYVDSQIGDVDFTIGDHEGYPVPGFQQDQTSIITKTSDGTYLFINEGRLFDANNQFVRTASKKDSIDIIQRIFQLSNNTGRFCDPATGAPTNNDYIWTNDYQVNANGSKNPVEVCGNCMKQVNLDKTCMDLDVYPPVIYMRSRILDRHGRNWVTDIHDDNYIKFRGPNFKENP